VKDRYNGLPKIPKNSADIADKIVKDLTQMNLDGMSRRARQIAREYGREEIGKNMNRL
jgi:hypothetical protein